MPIGLCSSITVNGGRSRAVSARPAPALRITAPDWWLKSDDDGAENHHGEGPRQGGRHASRPQRHPPPGLRLPLQHLRRKTDDPLRFEAELPPQPLEWRRGAESLHATALPAGPTQRSDHSIAPCSMATRAETCGSSAVAIGLRRSTEIYGTDTTRATGAPSSVNTSTPVVSDRYHFEK
jgi:hypothetical protein